jgi:hypothetical protein
MFLRKTFPHGTNAITSGYALIQHEKTVKKVNFFIFFEFGHAFEGFLLG